MGHSTALAHVVGRRGTEIWEPGAECGVRCVLCPLQAPDGAQLVEAVARRREPPAGRSRGPEPMTPATSPFSPGSAREEGASCLLLSRGQETGSGRDPGPRGQRCKGPNASYSPGTVPPVFRLALLVAFNPSSLSGIGNKIFKQQKRDIHMHPCSR